MDRLELQYWPLSKFSYYAGNPRKHDHLVDRFAAVIREFGFRVPVLALSSGEIVDGHFRVKAAHRLDLEEVPVLLADDMSEAQIKAFRLSINKTAEWADWDLALLRAEFEALEEMDFDLALTGFSLDEIAGIMVPDMPDPKCDPDEIPATVAEEPVSVPGDVWQCGAHLVMCGNALDLAHVEELLGGPDVQADMVWTDPPYLMDFRGAIDPDGSRRSRHKAITNDKMSKKDGEAFLRDVATMIRVKCRGSWYVSFYRLGIEWMMRAMTDVGLKWRNLIIWKKNNFNLSNSDYKSMYEPLIYGFADDYHAVLYGWNADHQFHGAKSQTDVMEVGMPSVWEIARTRKNDLHPTVKPVAVVERSLLNSSRPGEVVLDLFAGSGTTMIAAHKTGRVARLMELERDNTDIICRRYHAYTGEVPVHRASGAAFPIARFGVLPVQS